MFLYYEKPELFETKVKVDKIEGKKVILNESIFIPKTTEIVCDKGTINGIKVIEVIQKGDKVIHTLEKEPNFKKGELVVLKLDEKRRIKLMKLNTAMHFVYFAFKNLTYYEKLLKNEILEDYAYIDYKIDEPIEYYIKELQNELDEMINEEYDVLLFQDKKVKSRYWISIKDNKYPCKYPVVNSLKKLQGLKVTTESMEGDKERIIINIT